LDALLASNDRVTAFGFSWAGTPHRPGALIITSHVILRRADATGEPTLKLRIVFAYSQVSLLYVERFDSTHLHSEIGFARILELVFHGSEHDSEIAVAEQEAYRLLGDLNLVLLLRAPEVYFRLLIDWRCGIRTTPKSCR
jgi:hypothetical protein